MTTEWCSQLSAQKNNNSDHPGKQNFCRISCELLLAEIAQNQSRTNARNRFNGGPTTPTTLLYTGTLRNCFANFPNCRQVQLDQSGASICYSNQSQQCREINGTSVPRVPSTFRGKCLMNVIICQILTTKTFSNYLILYHLIIFKILIITNNYCLFDIILCYCIYKTHRTIYG